jgi:centromeric protein E
MQARTQLEDERRALAAFVSKFDALGLGGLMAEVASTPPSKLRAPMPSTGGAQRIFDERQHSRIGSLTLPSIEDASPARPEMGRAFVAQPSLLMEERLDEVQGDWTGVDDISFDLASKWAAIKAADDMAGRDVFGSRENLPA